MLEKKHDLDEVYGITRELPLNYVSRKLVDDALLENLEKGRHIIIFGSSKQGKTSLRKKCLPDEKYIIVHCSNKWKLDDLHSAILKQAGFQVSQSTVKNESGKNKIKITLKFPFSQLGGESVYEESVTRTYRDLDIDLSDVNDIVRALEGFQKYIVLEDFHYLEESTQRDFAVSMKAFHEQSKLCFIIIGVWLEEGRLTVYNGDLTGRIVGINADKWSTQELKEVIDVGESLLNIQFTDSFKDTLILSALDSVFIVQEVCAKACRDSGVLRTQEKLIEIGDGMSVSALIRDVVAQQNGRYNAFIRLFSAGFQATNLQMYKWLLYPVLKATTKDLENGLRLNQINSVLKTKIRKLNAGNVTQALQYAASLQVKKDIKPIVLDYDQTNLTLNIVDRSFMLWLDNQDRYKVLEVAGLPTG